MSLPGTNSFGLMPAIIGYSNVLLTICSWASLVNKNSIPSKVVEKNFSPCVVGLVTEAERLYDLRKNRLNSLKEDQNSEYVNIDKIRDELNSSRKLFKENNWPTIDVTRKSVEETAASVIKIYEIKNKKND